MNQNQNHSIHSHSQKSKKEKQVCNPEKYKTALCKRFNEKGKCKYKNYCQYAHGVEELNLYSQIQSNHKKSLSEASTDSNQTQSHHQLEEQHRDIPINAYNSSLSQIFQRNTQYQQKQQKKNQHQHAKNANNCLSEASSDTNCSHSDHSHEENYRDLSINAQNNILNQKNQRTSQYQQQQQNDYFKPAVNKAKNMDQINYKGFNCKLMLLPQKSVEFNTETNIDLGDNQQCNQQTVKQTEIEYNLPSGSLLWLCN